MVVSNLSVISALNSKASQGWKMLRHSGSQMQCQLLRWLLTRDSNWGVETWNRHPRWFSSHSLSFYPLKSGGGLLSMLEILNHQQYQPGTHQVLLRNFNGLSQRCMASCCWLLGCSQVAQLPAVELYKITSPFFRNTATTAAPTPTPPSFITWLDFA